MKVLLAVILASVLFTGLAMAVEPVDLSTLGKEEVVSTVEPVVLGASNPITYTPSFALGGGNITSVGASYVYTLPIALSSSNINYGSYSASVFTPAIALFGGA